MKKKQNMYQRNLSRKLSKEKFIQSFKPREEILKLKTKIKNIQ